MLDIVAKAIDQFYIKKDFASFKASCNQKLELFEGLKEYINRHRLVLVEGGDPKDYPSKYWYIHFDNYTNGEFELYYKTMLKISKVTPLFYMQHDFSVKNKDENGLDPYLEGFDKGICTKQQFDLNNKISEVLKKEGYAELEYVGMSEVVPGFKMPEEQVMKWGRNVLVEHLLFEDLFNIRNKQA